MFDCDVCRALLENKNKEEVTKFKARDALLKKETKDTEVAATSEETKEPFAEPETVSPTVEAKPPEVEAPLSAEAEALKDDSAVTPAEAKATEVEASTASEVKVSKGDTTSPSDQPKEPDADALAPAADETVAMDVDVAASKAEASEGDAAASTTEDKAPEVSAPAPMGEAGAPAGEAMTAPGDTTVPTADTEDAAGAKGKVSESDASESTPVPPQDEKAQSKEGAEPAANEGDETTPPRSSEGKGRAHAEVADTPVPKNRSSPKKGGKGKHRIFKGLPGEVQCNAVSTRGKPCRMVADPGSNRCYVHSFTDRNDKGEGEGPTDGNRKEALHAPTQTLQPVVSPGPLPEHIEAKNDGRIYPSPEEAGIDVFCQFCARRDVTGGMKPADSGTWVHLACVMASTSAYLNAKGNVTGIDKALLEAQVNVADFEKDTGNKATCECCLRDDAMLLRCEHGKDTDEHCPAHLHPLCAEICDRARVVKQAGNGDYIGYKCTMHSYWGLDLCGKCALGNKQDEMLECDGCRKGYHVFCLTPPLSIDDLPEGDWFCEKCVESCKSIKI